MKARYNWTEMDDARKFLANAVSAALAAAAAAAAAEVLAAAMEFSGGERGTK